MKRLGFSDRQLADLRGHDGGRGPRAGATARHPAGLQDGGHLRRRVPLGHALPLLLATTRRTSRAPDGRPTVIILGSGPNRIGQGVEFDYCCVRAALAFRELGYRTVMVNSNPETVSTDFDISDTLYFEPLTLEDVLEIVHVEQPIGVVVQLGGQTPLRLARGPRGGGRADPGHLAATPSTRRRTAAASRRSPASSGVTQPPSGTAMSVEEALAVADADRVPGAGPAVLRARRAGDADRLRRRRRCGSYFAQAARVAPGHPVLIDSFLEDAFEADVDAIADGTALHHRRRDAAHRGRRHPLRRLGLRAAALPDHRGRRSRRCGGTPGPSRCALGVVGLINVQYAIKDGVVYVLEVNPRGSRTIPFVVEDDRRPAGQPRRGGHGGPDPRGARCSRTTSAQPYVAVKEAVFPFNKLPGVDLILGPEMRSTGEVMGIADSFGMAFAKAQISADGALPLEGTVFVTVNDHDKANVVPIARRFHETGLPDPRHRGHRAPTSGSRGVPAERVLKVLRGAAQRDRPDACRARCSC